MQCAIYLVLQHTMGKYETKFNPQWTKTYSWIKKVDGDIYSAHCKMCNVNIRTGNSGLAQIRIHASGKKHKEILATLNNQTSQSTLVSTKGGVQLNQSRLHLMSMDDEVLQAEILWALKCIKSNYSFASNNGNNELFSSMFPDSAIAKSYKMSETKCKYLIQFGISPWVLEDLKNDFQDHPFSFLFDETTTVQVKKQYDAYVRYQSERHGEIVDRYCGSLFLGHCDADHLITNFCEFGKKLDWQIKYLLQIMMDGPWTNLSFMKKLTAELNNKNGKSVISVGTCSIHKCHNGFKKGLQKLSFNFDSFASDLHFFFKYSSARREDFKLMELITESDTAFMIRHASSRWLGLKKVLNRILDQWENLRQYFLKFLPKEKNFVKDIESTERYQRIRKILTSETSKLYMSFVVYIADILERFVLPFQCSKPMVHVLYPAMGDIFFTLMGNFVNPKLLTTKDAHELALIKLKQENLLSIHNMDFGAKATYQIGLLESKINLDVIKTEMKMAYVELTSYFQENFPHSNTVLKNLQYIHPTKVRHPNAVQSIRELSPIIATTLNGSKFTVLNTESYTDLVVQEFKMLQCDSTDQMEKLSSYAYWNEVSKIRNVHNEEKFSQISKMATAFMCLSHGNATPERGFSENRAVLGHRESLDEETIVSLRIAKDFIKHIPDISRFQVDRRLLALCSTARQKYHEYLEIQNKEKENSLKHKKEIEKKRKNSENQKLSDKVTEIDKEIEDENVRLSAAEILLKESNQTLVTLINSPKAVSKSELVKAQMILDTALNKIDGIKSHLNELNKNRNDLVKKKQKK